MDDMKISIRMFCANLDYDELLKVDALTYRSWKTEKWQKFSESSKTCIYVAYVSFPEKKGESDGHLDFAGFVAISMDSESIKIRRLAVHPAYRRFGVGRALMKKAHQRLIGDRDESFAIVPSSNKNLQLFLKAIGYTCEMIYEDYICDGEDGYGFSKKLYGTHSKNLVVVNKTGEDSRDIPIRIA